MQAGGQVKACGLRQKNLSIFISFLFDMDAMIDMVYG